MNLGKLHNLIRSDRISNEVIVWECELNKTVQVKDFISHGWESNEHQQR